MRRWRTLGFVAGLGFLLTLTTGACGSSDSDGGGTTPAADPNALISGTYCIVQFSGREGPPNEGRASWGTVISNGAGAITGAGMMTENENGTVTGPDPNGAAFYSVDAGRHLSVDLGGAPFFFGGVSADGSVFVLSAIANEPAIVIGIRKSGTYDAGSLTGQYHVCGFGYDQGTGEDLTHWGTLTFDGVGGGTSLARRNRQGSIGVPLGPTALTYAVAADGTVTGMFLTYPLTGQVHASGELVTLAGATAGGFPIVLVLIKAAVGATNATLTGAYHAVAMEADNGAPPDTWLSAIAGLTADGAGMFMSGPFTSNSDGMVLTLPPFPGSVPYTVAGNGALTTGDYEGGVSPSGRFAMYAGGVNPLDDPEFWFLMR